MKQIKALRTFAAGKVIFYPHVKEPYTVKAEMADSWERSGHCVIVSDLQEQAPDVEPEQAPGETVIAKGVTATETDQAPPKEEVGAPEAKELTYNQMKAAAKKAGIKGYNTMKKDDLKDALKGV